MENNKRKSFIVYTSWKDSIERLSVEEQAQFLKNLFYFYTGDEDSIQVNTPLLGIFWDSIKFNLEENERKHRNSQIRMKENSKNNPKLQKTRHQELIDPTSGIDRPDTGNQITRHRELIDPTSGIDRPDTGNQITRHRVSNDNVNDNDNDNVNDKGNDKGNENGDDKGFETFIPDNTLDIRPGTESFNKLSITEKQKIMEHFFD